MPPKTSGLNACFNIGVGSSFFLQRWELTKLQLKFKTQEINDNRNILTFMSHSVVVTCNES